MFYYLYYWGTSQRVTVQSLGIEDPFALEPAEIVERVLALGFRRDTSSPRSEPNRAAGMATEVKRDGLTYRVTVSRDTGQIAVSEMRADAYDVLPSDVWVGDPLREVGDELCSLSEMFKTDPARAREQLEAFAAETGLKIADISMW